MTFTSDRILTQSINLFDAVSVAYKAFSQLSADDKLGLLWVVYENMGGSVTPAATGAARLQFAQGLLTQVKELGHDAQLEFMRGLVDRQNTSMTRSYGVLTSNTKLAFWYQLAEMMRMGTVVNVPAGYQLSRDARKVFGMITVLEFGQQISFLRKVATKMGHDPLG
ncbi:MAG: orange carotenoid protein N-terminal domain-containing protein [Cyanobacteria bacterium P01_F01_bin.150]